MTPPALVAAFGVGLAVHVGTGSRGPRAGTRLAVLGLAGRPTADESRPAGGDRVRTLGVVAGLSVALLVPSWYGPLLGLAVAVGAPRWASRLESAEVRQRRLRMAADAPFAVELIAACLLAGSPPRRALSAVAVAVGGPVGQVLDAVATSLAVGSEPRIAWASLRSDPQLGRLARAMVRADVSGAPLAAALEHAARDMRADRRVAADAAARRVGILAVAPLGACFLPGCILLGIVPVVWGLTTATFGSTG